MLLTVLLLPLSLPPTPSPPPPVVLAEEPLFPPAFATPLAVDDEEEIAKGWTGAIGLGVSAATGNTERVSANATGDARLRRERDRFTLGANWNYAAEEDEDGESSITERRIGGRFKYDYFLTDRSYLLFNAFAERDDLQDLQLRASAGVGYGYQWIEEETRALATELGVNWFHEDFEGESPNEYPAGRAAYDAMYKPGPSWTLQQLGEIYPSLEHGDDIFSKLDTRARYSFSENLFAQAQWVWDWNNTPAEGKERSDHRYFLTLGFSF